MNTTEVGDAFENRCFDAICIGIKEGQLGIVSNDARAFQKKAYFSRKRQDHIIIDISIEIWPPNAIRPSITYLIECKDYKRKVEVGRVDEFAGKVDQIADGGFNVKGVFISGSSFQQGALEVAKNLGFMVIELNELNQLDIKFHKKEKGKNKSQRFLEADEKVYQFFKKIFDPSQNQSIPVLSKKNIAKHANEVLNDFNPQILERGHKLSIDKLIDYFTLKHNITFKTIPNITANESDLLGYFDLNDKKININEKLEWEGNRKAFVIAHEIGHFILHKDIQVTQDYYDSFSDSEFDFRTNKYTLNNFKNWIEWQANYFAACLLMPELPLRYHLIKFQTRAGISKQGRIYLDRQPVNWRDYYAIINYLSDHFNTTNTSLIYRLEEFNIITYDPSILHWQTINELSTNEYIEKHSVYAKEKEDNYDK